MEKKNINHYETIDSKKSKKHKKLNKIRIKIVSLFVVLINLCRK